MIIVTGSPGQLGSAFKPWQVRSDIPTVVFSKESFDITNPTHIENILLKKANHSWTIPSVLINCAAYTNVDIPLSDRELARNTNYLAVKGLVDACNKVNCKFVQISTDYVFDGAKMAPYVEEDAKNPLNEYGLFKSLAEDYIVENCNDYLIIRTSWLYGGKNARSMVNWILNTQQPQCIVDHIGKLTHVNTVVNAVKRLLELKEKGYYHVTDEEETFPYEIAKHICQFKNKLPPKLILAQSLKRGDLRPKDSALDCTKVKSLGIKLNHWKQNLEEYLDEYNLL